jgi:hypothetical protein
MEGAPACLELTESYVARLKSPPMALKEMEVTVSGGREEFAYESLGLDEDISSVGLQKQGGER